jgi:hypothetical protein
MLGLLRPQPAEKLEQSMQSITGSEQLEPKQKAELADFVSAFAGAPVHALNMHAHQHAAHTIIAAFSHQR